MWELTESKPLVKITLISGREFIADINQEVLQKAMEMGTKIVKINWILINVWSISTVEPYNADVIEQFINWITDIGIKDRLWEIYKERKSKNLRIADVKHLMQIYTDRFWEISNEKSFER
jgi:molybdenum cofactor biosynthesis enzyme MoaA